jgi:ribonuclease R
VTGGLLFEMLTEALLPDPNMPRPRLGIRGKPAIKPRGGLPKGVRRGKRR